MMSTKLLSLLSRTAGISRHLCSAVNLTTVEIDDKTGIATLSMNRPPINALNVELLRELHQSIREIEHNGSRGLILASSLGNIFSAGLDIREFYKPDMERARLLWTSLQDVWFALYGSALPTAAAINGHAPAGGCFLATCCEYRVMRPGFTIGLNEAVLGIVPPLFIVFNYLSVLPRRVSERALMQGRMFSTEEALQLGLVDEIAASKEEALAKCTKFIGTFTQVNPVARSLTKQQFRSADIEQFQNEREQDLESFLAFVRDPQMQEGVGKYLEGLKNKSSK